MNHLYGYISTHTKYTILPTYKHEKEHYLLKSSALSPYPLMGLTNIQNHLCLMIVYLPKFKTQNHKIITIYNGCTN